MALVHALGAPAGLIGLTVETSLDFVAGLLQWLEMEENPHVIEAGAALNGEEEAIDKPRPWKARVWVTTEKFGRARCLLDSARAESKRQE